MVGDLVFASRAVFIFLGARYRDGWRPTLSVHLDERRLVLSGPNGRAARQSGGHFLKREVREGVFRGAKRSLEDLSGKEVGRDWG